jgi:hypothetical protein
LFTFVISLVVVGAALLFATRLVLSEAPTGDKPATSAPERVGGEASGHDSASAIAAAARWTDHSLQPELWQRIRSGVLLAALLTVLGALAALVLVIGGAVLLSGLRTAVQ